MVRGRTGGDDSIDLTPNSTAPSISSSIDARARASPPPADPATRATFPSLASKRNHVVLVSAMQLRRQLVRQPVGGSVDVLDQLVDRTADWLAYELPPQYRSAKTGRGQVQQWFLFEAKLGNVALVADSAGGGEARALAWMSIDELIEGAVEFRREVDRVVAARFGL